MLQAILNQSWRQHPHKVPTIRPPAFHQCPACLVRLTWIVFVMGGK